MTLILAIETATPVCSIAIFSESEIIIEKSTSEKNAHSSLLTVFMEEAMRESKLNFSDLDAVAVSKGPGSYTGLRIGVSAAKGLCYALDIPLIAVNTLQSMAGGLLVNYKEQKDDSILFCPMIDARRMEVYSAVFDSEIKVIRETKAEIIDENSFSEYLRKSKMIFFGDGAAKCKELISHPNAEFNDDFIPSATHMKSFALEKFRKNQFEDVAYFEPFYLKDFIVGIPKVKGLK